MHNVSSYLRVAILLTPTRVHVFNHESQYKYSFLPPLQILYFQGLLATTTIKGMSNMAVVIQNCNDNIYLFSDLNILN